MNTIIIIAATLLIILVILLFVYRQKNNKLLAELKAEKEKYIELNTEAKLLRTILIKYSFMIKQHLSPLKRDTMPFKIIKEIDMPLVDLVSIRFKKVKDTVLVYINGAMIPYPGTIKFNYPDIFTPTNFNVIDDTITVLHKKQYENVDIKDALYKISQTLNN